MASVSIDTDAVYNTFKAVYNTFKMKKNSFNNVHNIVLLIAISAICFTMYPNNMISRRYIAGNQYKQLSDEIEMANDITFEHIYESWVAKWDVLFLGYDGDYHSIYDVKDGPKRPEKESHSISFMRYNYSRNSSCIPRKAAKIYTDDQTPLYYMVKVTCEVTHHNTDKISKDTVFLKMGLPSKLPPAPEILGMRYENIVYDRESDCMLDSDFSIDLKCEGAALCQIQFNSQSTFSNSEDVFLNISQQIHLDHNYTVHYKFLDADWGTIMVFSGYNEFGRGEYTERYFTTDYIYDPEILARIEELKNIANGLGDTKQVKIPISDSISVTDEYVYCTGAISNLDLYDMSGNLLSSVNGVGLIRTDNLPHGVYVLKYTETDGTTHSRKILSYKIPQKSVIS